MFKISLGVIWTLVVVALVGCGGGKNKGQEYSPPEIVSAKFSLERVPRATLGEQFTQRLEVVYQDADGDANRLTIRTLNPDQSTTTINSPLRSTGKANLFLQDFLIDSNDAAGEYRLTLQVFDAQQLASAAYELKYQIVSGVVKPIEITAINPTQGVPGDLVKITGLGFDKTAAKNFVQFKNAYGGAPVVSATETELVVTVPERAISGTLAVQNDLGRAVSALAFSITPTIALNPTTTQLGTEKSMPLSCVTSGVEDGHVHWLINGQSAPPVSLGSIDAAGRYTAPASVPSPQTVTITCVSDADANLRADATVTVLAPALPAGSGMIAANRPADIVSADRETRLTVAAGSVTQDVTIQITTLEPPSVAASSIESYNLAAVKFEPTGLMFTKPATVRFALRNWMAPGRNLPLYQVNESSGALEDTGTVVTVDDSGMSATGTITHFSIYVVGLVAVAEEATLAQLAARFALETANFSLYIIRTHVGVGLLEGLTVPIVVGRKSGSTTGAGPFARGVQVGVEWLDAGLNAPQGLSVGSFVQPSAEGWQLATAIKIPVIFNCNEGQEARAQLVIGYTRQGVADTMRVPFTVECLDEFPGSDVLISDRTHVHRYSTLSVNGELNVLADQYTLPDPLRIWATNKIYIHGQLRFRGTSGTNGLYGNAASEVGGVGGGFGHLYGGHGGHGGPYRLLEPYCVTVIPIGQMCTDLNKDGEAGQNAATGALGGLGGAYWEKGSVLSAFVDGALALFSIVDMDFIGAIQNIYNAAEETVKIINNSENQIKSAGKGGAGPTASSDPPFWDLSTFTTPQAGAGGGGGGKMSVELDADANGGGGGGGGGAAPAIELITAGETTLVGMIDGRGGDGGRGGSGSWDKTGPGGGGAGGNGAQLVLVTKKLDNFYGVIDLKGGVGGISGQINSGTGLPHALVKTGFGAKGRDGYMRLHGELSGDAPQNAKKFYLGPRLGAPLNTEVVNQSRWCRTVSLGEQYGAPGNRYYVYTPIHDGVEGDSVTVHYFDWSAPHAVSLCFDLHAGMNTLSLKVFHGDYYGGTPHATIALHPWESQIVYYYPGLQDSDNDGLSDGLEIAIGTDPQLSDTDGDGYKDGYEYNYLHTDPKVTDRYQLTLNIVPYGGGLAYSSPIGPYHNINSAVTLSAETWILNPYYQFYQWRGDLTGNQNPATIVMDKNKTIYAEFLYTNYTYPAGTLLPAKAVEPTTPTSNLGAPRVEMTAGGDAVIAWRQDDRVLARNYDAAGGWGNTVDLGAAVDGQPQLATNRYGETIAVWDHWDAANTRWQIYANRFNGEQRWHDPQLIADSAGKDINSPPLPLAATNDNLSVVLMWHVVSNDATSGVYTKRFETATGWQTTKTINSPHGGEHRLALDNQGHAVLVWNLSGNVWARVLKKVGDTDQLIPAVRLSEAGTSNNVDARVTLDRRNVSGNQGNATVVWAKGSDIVSYRFAYKVDAIDTTGPREVVDNQSASAQTPHIVIDQRNNVLAVWKQGIDLWSNQYIEELGHWLTPTRIEQNSAVAGEPRLRIDGYGNAMAMWGQGGEMHLARYRAAQGWQPDTVIATPAANTVLDAPRVDLDQNGNAFAVWREWNASAMTGKIGLRYFSTNTTDSDGDGLTDAEELVFYGTYPDVSDSDGDTFSDGDEVAAGTDPMDKLSHP